MRTFLSTLLGLCLAGAAAAQATSAPATTTTNTANGANTTTPDNAAADAFSGSTDVMLGLAGLWFPSQTEYGQTLDETNSGGIAASLRLHISPWNSVEARFTYSRNSHNFYPSWSVGASTRELMFNYVATLPTDARIQPYLLAGAGFLNFDINTLAPNYVSTSSSISSQTNLAVDYGAGVDYKLRDHFKARAEFRIIDFKAPDFGATNVNNLRLDNWTMCLQPTLGLAYNF